MKTLLTLPLLAALAACTRPLPPQERESLTQIYLRQQQDAADFEALQLEKAYERMPIEERMRGIVYGE